MSGQKLRILLLTYQGGIAGSTNSITYLAKGLADRGHQIYVGIRKEMPIWDLIEHPDVTRVPMRISSKFDIKNWIEIRDLVRKEGIQLINAQSSHDRYTSIFAKLFFRLPVKIVHTRRQNPLSSGGWMHAHFYTAFTDGIVVISNGLKDIFIQKGYRADHLKVIHNGIPKERLKEWDENKVEDYKARLKLNSTDQVVGCISRLKEQSQLIEAITLLDDPSIKLIFAGTEAEQIEPLLKKNNIKNEVHLLGKLPPQEILNIYRLLDINVLASTMDGFGLVLIESMAMECPVIATNFGGIPDVIQDGENGYLFDNGNIEQLADRISILLRDDDIRTRFIQNGLKTAYDTFNMDDTITDYENYFNDLIHGKA